MKVYNVIFVHLLGLSIKDSIQYTFSAVRDGIWPVDMAVADTSHWLLHSRRETVLIFGEIFSPVETAVTSSVFPIIPVIS